MEYPAEYEAYICRIIENYRKARTQIQNAASFLFFTDIHIHLNGRSSVPLIRKIGRETDVKTVLCGGDFVWAFGTKAECVSQFDETFAYLDPVKDTMALYMARGNHDATIRNSWEDDGGYTMPYTQIQARFAAHNSPATCAPEGKLYYYADDPESKVRYVVLDTCEHQLAEDTAWGVRYGMEEEQLRWLAQKALLLPEGWAAVVMGHVACVPQIPSYSTELDPLAQILTAFKHKTLCAYGDFRENRGELIAYLCGHNHKDRSAVVDGVLHISTGCDAYCRDDDLPRGVGTVDNVLLDLFLVDRDQKAVQIFRVGAGKSREFSY